MPHFFNTPHGFKKIGEMPHTQILLISHKNNFKKNYFELIFIYLFIYLYQYTTCRNATWGNATLPIIRMK